MKKLSVLLMLMSTAALAQDPSSDAKKIRTLFEQSKSPAQTSYGRVDDDALSLGKVWWCNETIALPNMTMKAGAALKASPYYRFRRWGQVYRSALVEGQYGESVLDYVYTADESKDVLVGKKYLTWDPGAKKGGQMIAKMFSSQEALRYDAASKTMVVEFSVTPEAVKWFEERTGRNHTENAYKSMYDSTRIVMTYLTCEVGE